MRLRALALLLCASLSSCRPAQAEKSTLPRPLHPYESLGRPLAHDVQRLRRLLGDGVTRVVITGGAGYVGSHTTHALARTGEYDILVIDNLESGHAEAVPHGVTLKVLHLDDVDQVKATFNTFRPHAVIDFAAYLDVGHSQEHPEEYVRNNVQNFKHVVSSPSLPTPDAGPARNPQPGQGRLCAPRPSPSLMRHPTSCGPAQLDAMVESGCHLIIKSSTQATYGDAPQSAMPLREAYNAEGAEGTAHFVSSNLADGSWNGTALTGQQLFDRFVGAYESYTPRAPWLALTPSERVMLHTPRSVYGLSKLLDEVMMRKYAKRHHNLRWVSLRYGNVCGAAPSGHVGEAKRRPHTLMTLAIYSLTGRRKPVLNLYGSDYETPDGTTVRDYVHPSDLATAHAEALKYLLAGNASDVFNLGTGHGSSVLQVLHAIEAASGRKVQTDFKPRRTGDCAFSVLDISKARAALGYKPIFDLDDMARSAWRWHVVHQEAFNARPDPGPQVESSRR